MPRIIFKCPYIKPGTQKNAAHLNNYVRYVATREGVQEITQERSKLPATKNQQAMVKRLLRDFPMSRGMFEYEDYAADPTQGNASEFITRALEDYWAPAEAQRSGFGGERSHSEMSELSPQGGSEGYGACGDDDQITKRENYVSYIAQRPRAERVGSHGLFNGADEPIPLSLVAEEVANHPGNVWLPIISLRREDAARLGYDNAKQWRALLTTFAPEISEAMKIPWDQFRWYAAFHDEGHHPHVHMVCYSADGRSGFLNDDGIARIKSGLAKNIFRQELTELYQQQTQRRDELVRKSGQMMRELIRQMRSGTLESPRIEQLMEQLSERLKRAGGKKQYGYLKAPLKAVVDEIVDELAKDSRVAAAYDPWYQLREEVLRTYKGDLPQRLPLSQQKEFKRIKNLVIEEAVRLGEYAEVFSPADTTEQELTESNMEPGAVPGDAPQSADVPGPDDEAPPVVVWSERYKQARSFLFGDGDTPQDLKRAYSLFMEGVNSGNALAMYDLGKLFAEGAGVDADAEQSQIWYAKALTAFQAVERQRPNRYVEYRIGKMYAGGLGTEKDEGAALKWLEKSAAHGNPHAQYQWAKHVLADPAAKKAQAANAVTWLTKAAAAGLDYAQYALGKLYRDGGPVERDMLKAVIWFHSAAEQGSEYARFFLDHMDDSPPLFASAVRLLYHMGNIFRDQTPRPAVGINFVDSKLRRRIKEKKIAMGHKPDDHEEQIQQFQ